MYRYLKNTLACISQEKEHGGAEEGIQSLDFKAAISFLCQSEKEPQGSASLSSPAMRLSSPRIRTAMRFGRLPQSERPERFTAPCMSPKMGSKLADDWRDGFPALMKLKLFSDIWNCCISNGSGRVVALVWLRPPPWPTRAPTQTSTHTTGSPGLRCQALQADMQTSRRVGGACDDGDHIQGARKRRRAA